MAVTDRNKRGEKFLYRSEVTKNDDSALLFSDMTTVEVVVRDTAGVKISKTKAGGGVVEGSATNEIEFELTDVETKKLGAGLIYIDVEVTYTDADFSDTTAVKNWTDSFELFP